MVNTLVARKKPVVVNTLVPKKKPAVNTLVPKKKPAVNTLVPKKKTKTKEEIAAEARKRRIAAIKKKRDAPGSKFRRVRPSVTKAPKSRMGTKGGKKRPSKRKEADEESDLDDFIVNDEDSEDEYYEIGTDSEGADSDIEDLDEFKGKSLDEKEEILKKRQEDRKGNIEALIARLEAKARKKAKKDGLKPASEEAFVKEVRKSCPDVAALKQEMAQIKKELAECRAKKCKATRKRSKKTPKTTEIKPVPKDVSDAVRKARIAKIRAKRASGGMKRPTRKPRARKPLKECKPGYTRGDNNRCKKDKVEREDSEKVKFAKALIQYDEDALRRTSTGEKPRGAAKAVLKKIDAYFDSNMAISKKQRLQNKAQSEAFNAAREIYYLNNPDKRPKRKRSAKK